LAKKNPHMPIVLYDPVKDYVEAISKTGMHPQFHKNGPLFPFPSSSNHPKRATNKFLIIDYERADVS